MALHVSNLERIKSFYDVTVLFIDFGYYFQSTVSSLHVHQFFLGASYCLPKQNNVKIRQHVHISRAEFKLAILLCNKF